MIKEWSFRPHVLAMAVFFAFASYLDLTAGQLGKKQLFETIEGFKLVEHVIETLASDEFGCGVRCLRNKNCQSYNSRSPGKHGNMTCELSDKTRRSSPENFMPSPGFTYFGHVGITVGPGFSCKDILNNGGSFGNGEYWIDPEKSGNPFKVYCDMTTDGGGWLLIFNVVVENQDSLPTLPSEASYRRINSYRSNKLVLAHNAFKELSKHLPFTQIRFFCRKRKGNTFHVATVTNSTGETVVQFFTGENDDYPGSCGSFKRMKGDNSRLALECTRWGRSRAAKWGHSGTREFYDHAAYIPGQHHWLIRYNRWECDDSHVKPSTGDFWKIFVR